MRLVALMSTTDLVTASFIKSHSILYEEFLDAKKKLGIKSDLHLYPATSFADDATRPPTAG